MNLTTGTGTHKYKSGSFESPYWASVMNKNTSLKWNTILFASTWGDIRDAYCGDGGPCPSPRAPRADLLWRVLRGVMPVNCMFGRNPVDLPDETDAPKRTALYQNVPNPFNPTTAIHFDLAQDAHVELVVYDVAGKRVRSLLNERLSAGRAIQVVWDGVNDAGERVGSGVYLYRLVSGDFSATRKMIVLR